ncbi:hypothetical protein ACIOD1_13050 [Streptomyces sp. NPDC088097]|uniref:hypothetical protein n=1 Tax=Streptomyces sp. NPDC088097 TaxID=3365823 RepID=UPI0037F1160E
MSLTIGELVARIDADDSAFLRGLSDAELEMRGFQREITGGLRTLDWEFAQLGDLRAAELRLNGFVQHADGSLRTLTGQFAELNRPVHVEMEADSSGVEHAVERVVTSMRSGDREGHRFSGTLRGLGSAAGALGSVAATAGTMAAGLGAVVPIAAGLAATLANIAPAAGVGATAVFALAQATAAFKIGTSGISEAVGAAGKSAGVASGQAKAAASAQQSLTDAVKSAARANEQAAKQVATAERGLADAQRESRAAQMALNDAREQGARDLEDINNRLADAELSQRDAVLDIADAEAELAKARQSGDPKDIARAQLAYDRAVQRLKEQTTETARLRAETAKANTAGVEGSNAVRQAQERIADTQRTVADSEQTLADARQDAARTAADGIEQVRRAQEALAEAGASSGGADPFAEAMAKLAPAAREFVTALMALKPAWESLRLDVQQTLMQGLAGEMTRTAGSVLPVLRKGLVDSAGALNLMGRGVLDAARELADSGTLGRAMSSASAGLKNLSRAPGQVVTGLGQVAAAAGPAFERLTAAAAKGLDGVAARMASAFESGRMQTAIDQAIGLIGQLFDVFANVGDIFASVLGPMETSGGGFIGILQDITRSMADAFATPAVQAGLKAIYETMSVLGKTVGPLLADALQAIAPIFVALGPPIQTLIKAFGEALGPVIKALGPVLESAAKAFGELITAISPLLPVAGELIAALLPALTPLFDGLGVVFKELAPVIKIVAGILKETLGPIFAQLPGIIGPIATLLAGQLGWGLKLVGELLTTLAPSFKILGETIGKLMIALGPLIQVWGELIAKMMVELMPFLIPLIQLIGDLATIFADQLAGIIISVVIPAIEMITKLLQGDFSGAWDAAKRMIMGMMVTWLNLFENLPTRIWDALSKLGDKLAERLRDAGDRAAAVLIEKRGVILTTLARIPAMASEALGDLGWVLWNAGARLIGGLIDGLRAMVPSLKEHLSWITNMMPSWKGPPETDARILTPAGRSLIEGFQRGISLATPGLQDQLAGLTGSLPGMALAPAGAMGGPGGPSARSVPRVIVEVEGPDAMKQFIRRIVASDGGDVQQVLGRVS